MGRPLARALYGALGIHGLGVAGICAMCGENAADCIDAAKAIASSFSGFADLRAPCSPLVCGACVWAMAGKPPNTLRMWTVAWRSDRPAVPSATKAMRLPGIHLTSRANMREVVDLLLSPPDAEWGVAVALSGQKHVVPFARTNIGHSWVVRMEGATVAGDPVRFAPLLYSAATLRLAGFSSDDIAGRSPPLARLTGEALATWRQECATIEPHRASHLLELALACINKEHANEVREKAAAVR